MELQVVGAYDFILFFLGATLDHHGESFPTMDGMDGHPHPHPHHNLPVIFTTQMQGTGPPGRRNLILIRRYLALPSNKKKKNKRKMKIILSSLFFWGRGGGRVGIESRLLNVPEPSTASADSARGPRQLKGRDASGLARALGAHPGNVSITSILARYRKVRGPEHDG